MRRATFICTNSDHLFIVIDRRPILIIQPTNQINYDCKYTTFSKKMLWKLFRWEPCRAGNNLFL